jgi:cobalt-zinc-cadmium efflux system outer membrane protein
MCSSPPVSFRDSFERFRIVGLFLATVLGLVEPSGLGQPLVVGTNRLSMAEARRTAFERNWDFLAARSGVDEASAQLMVAREFPNPTLSLSTSRIGSHENGTVAGNGFWNRSYDTIVALNQLVEIGGKRRDRQASAGAGVAGAKARFREVRRQLDQGVARAYVGALLAEERARALGESAGMLQHEADIAQVRLKAGDISDSDEKQIANGADVFELQARSAGAAAVQARIAVEVLMGVEHPEGAWIPADTLAEAGAGLKRAEPLETGGMRPDVAAVEADFQRSQHDLALEKAMRIPDPTVSLLAEHNPPGGGPAADTFGIGVSFPLPLWSRNRGRIEAARARVEEYGAVFGKARAQAAADVVNARVGYREAAGRLDRYRDKILPRSKQVRESVAFAYEKGGASLLDLLEVQRADNDARLATAQAQADTAVAIVDLNAALDVVTPQNP